MAAALSDPEVGRKILDRFEEWIAIVEESLGRATASTPVASLVPRREAAYAISAMFLGIELMTRLDPERSEAGAVFDMMAVMARLIEEMGPVLFPAG